MGLVQTYDGLVRAIDGVVCTGCGCTPCDCEVDGPTASFDYDQVDDSPCTIDLTDESVAGACGAIVAWRWLKNGVEFSTSQNPSGVTVASGDDITLEVTDSKGCTDSVVMEVACTSICFCCTVAIKTCDIIISGFTNNGCVPAGAGCPTLNGSWSLEKGAPNNGCAFLKDFGFHNGCVDPNPPLADSAGIQVEICTANIPGVGRAIEASMFSTGRISSRAHYRKPISTTPVTDCRGTHVLNLVSNAGGFCNVPSTVTVILG